MAALKARSIEERIAVLQVSGKGGISVYGLQRMPVTLYVEQWQRLLDFADEIRKFMKDHDAELKRKEPKTNGS